MEMNGAPAEEKYGSSEKLGKSTESLSLIKPEQSTESLQNGIPALYRTKVLDILHACSSQDAEVLRKLAVSDGGLVSDELRRQAWPILLGLPAHDQEIKSENDDSWEALPRHPDEDQVQLDVNRAFIYYPNHQTEKQLDHWKSELSSLITEVLRRHPFLRYVQGYHDICQVLLLVLSTPLRAPALSRLSILRIRDFMLPSMDPTLAQIRLIPAILFAANQKLYHHLPQTQPNFAIPGTLTMYAHSIQEYGDIARLFDAFLAREAVFSLYMFAQIVLDREEELLDMPADDQDMFHAILSKLPKRLDVEALIANTVTLFDTHPPESLYGWSSVSGFSVLKTARFAEEATKQTLEDGEVWFEKHSKELEERHQDGEAEFQKLVTELMWAERRDKALAALWKYRKPVAAVGIAVLAAAVSYQLRKSPSIYGLLSAFRK